MQETNKSYPLEEALKAQQALREFGNLAPEQFPMQAFVGMISDEIQHLRELGHSDDKISEVIRAHSSIQISAAEIAENYAPNRRK